jgi:hypothetical protein
LSLLDPVSGTAESAATVTTAHMTFAANGTGSPGAGTWKIGECIANSGTAITQNDWVLGYAFVVNGTPAPGSTAVRPGGGTAPHNG